MNSKSDNPRSLRDVSLKIRYRSDKDRLVPDFYIPCLERSTSYDRAAGYASAGGLSAAAKGLAAFLRNDGRVRLVASPNLTKEDLAAISSGYAAIDDKIVERLIGELEGTVDKDVLARLSVLGALIAAKRLDIKLAYRIDEHNQPIRGIYHEKFGIFRDLSGQLVVFTGSPNETGGGFLFNFESIQVFRSWYDPEDRIPEFLDDFEALWDPDLNTPGLRILEFPDAARRKLIKIHEVYPCDFDPEDVNSTTEGSSSLSMSGGFTPREYQRTAITEWADHDYRGILKMATGTGKTLTALYGFSQVRMTSPALTAIIVVPYKHLAEQWAEECQKQGHRTIICSSDYAKWKISINDLRFQLESGQASSHCVIVTYDTYRSDDFRNIITRFNSPLLLIADEVHHLGARCNQLVPEQFEFRLGLSATPERTFDPEGTAWLCQHVGQIVFEYTLQQAIPRFLSPYHYYVHIVSLTDEETREYKEVMTELSRAYGSISDIKDDDIRYNGRVGPLLRRRADIIGGAANKTGKLRELLSNSDKQSLYFTLFYLSSRGFDEIQNLLGNEMRLKIRKFTFEESRAERASILDDFRGQRINAIVAKKCLDEGMDIPATRIAYILASSSNPMEFVQRRGRILRRAPNKDFAVIHDFFVVPSEEYSVDKYDQKLVERELTRATEFSKTALNWAECASQLLPIKIRYNLLHL